MPASVASAESTVALAAAQEGLPDAATALFDPPLLLLPFRASELPPEVKHKTDQLVESNMRAIYEASGWSEENEAPEGANGEVLYLLLFQHHQEHPGAIATDSAKQEQTPDSQDDDVKHMAAIADGIIGFVAAEFSVEGDKPALYIVELQLAPKELLAWSRGLERIVLTVQTANHGALAFYARQGYTPDPTSPEQCPEDFGPEDRTYRKSDGSMEFSYRILCKQKPAIHRSPQMRRRREETEAGSTTVDADEKVASNKIAAAKRRRQEATNGL